jgi:hypothetical protein
MLDKSGIFSIKGLDNLKINYFKKICKRLASKIWRIKNWEYLREYKKKYDRQYIDSKRAVVAYWNNREKRLATKRIWEAKNKERRYLMRKINDYKHKLKQLSIK